MSDSKQCTHVIFDMDGLLLDTESLYTKVTAEILARFNKEYTYEIKRELMGKPSADAGRRLVELTGIDMSPEDYLEERTRKHREVFPFAELMPGAQWLVETLHQNNVPICVATSSNKDIVDLKIQKHKELFKLFDHIVCGDDEEVAKGKPNPDIFLVAASRFDPPANPSKCVVFEDSPAGVKAAKSAGMSCIMVPDPREKDHGDSDDVLSTLEHFKPADWGLTVENVA
eukprot:Clim_evm51s172 gene=Clim_evmTU51s172